MIDAILRLHTDRRGIVWCGQNGVTAFCSELPPTEFVRRQVFRTASAIRLLGVPENADLIVQTHEQLVRQSTNLLRQTVRLYGPGLCPDRDDPLTVLRQLWQAGPVDEARAGSRAMTTSDFNMFMLVRSLRERHGAVDDQARSLFRYHPAWPVFTYLPELDTSAAIRLVCEIIDPRWFRDPARPHRLQMLYKHLGLDLETLERVLASHQNSSLTDRERRALQVLLVWNGLRQPNTVDLSEPRNFLWRIRACAAGTAGLLKACRSFLRLLTLYWTQRLTACGRQIFRPAECFRSEQETRSFRAHVERSRNT
jgi:hypothetical protein